ncbi:amino acid adenylation domain-containing protein [Actinokineospora guangxiensis]|uniref:Amino acid adenylation domain-containing protein n=1 Tax=Actinokineospora guangxiensis TaxID=1490288 RepID=A0ABW0EGF8_9PSEU
MTGTLDSAALRAELLRRRLRGTAAPAAGIEVQPRDRPLPLSPAQRRMWILDQLRPGSTEYLMTSARRVRGPLDTAALRTALDGLVARHETLRTRFPLVDGEPVQVIDPPSPAVLDVVDLTALPGAEQQARVAAIASTERVPVDLADGPMLRATLAVLSDVEHVLVLTVHHVAADGWSEDILLRELRTGYDAALAGKPAPHPSLPVQYADYAAWQAGRLSGDRLDKEVGYWRDRLAGVTPVELPADRPRPAVRDGAGDLLRATLPAEVAQPLLALAKARGASPFLLLSAAVAVLLGRHTGSTDITIGTPVAGRDRAEVQDVVGLFLNTIVLRADLSGAPTFGEVLDRVRATAMDAYSHQDVPFEKLVDELSPERDPSRTPLFSTMVLWQDADAAVPAAGLAFEPVAVGETTAKFDLTVSATPRADGGIALAFTYATALFDAATVRRVADRMAALLASAVAHPDTPVADLPALPEAELADVLHTWNATSADYPAATLTELLSAQAARTPDAVAVRFAGAALTYAELDAESSRLAHQLSGLGVGPESVVAVCLPRSAGLVTALVGVLKAGGAYLPLDPDYPAERLAYMLADSGARVLVADEARPDVEHTVLIGQDRSALPAAAPSPAITPDNAAYVIYTSGSTGRPKGVLVPHRGIVNRLLWMQDEYGLDGTDRVLQKTPYSFDVSVWEFFWPLITGATLVVAAPGGHRDPAYLAELIRAEGVTTLHFVPSMLRAFLAYEVGELPSLRRMMCSGEALPADLVTGVAERIGCPLHNLYGPTEASVDVTYTPCTPGEPVTIGWPVANTRTYVVDADLRPVPLGVPGELVLAGVQLARGYLAKPGLTAERFVPDPFAAEPGGRVYRTGDLVRQRADGAVEYLGRIDHQVKVNGHRIELGEIEAVLTEHPGVADAAVAVRDGQLVAYTVGTADADALRAHLAARLPEHMVPAHWMAMDALPLTSSGKTDRGALPAPERTRGTEREFLAPRTELEAAVATALAGALGIEAVGVHDSFFQLGGDSMRAIRAVGLLRSAGLTVSVQDMFTHQSAAALAALIERGAGTAVDEIVVERFAQLSADDRALLPADVVDAYPLAMTQAGMTYEMLAADHRAVYQNVSCYIVRDDLPFAVEALRSAGESLIARHEILRTSFDLAGYSEPLQLVHAEAHLPVEWTDLTGLDAAEQRRVVEEFLLSERGKPVDIAHAPQLRYHVHQISETEFWLTHTEAHAILDGWSHTSVVAELIDTYRAIRHDRDPGLKPVPEVRFADFIALERKALASPEQRAFWAGKVHGDERLTLPEAWGAHAADRKATIVEVQYADLLPRLRALAAVAGASLKSVLHSAHLKAMSVVTGRTRFFGGLVCNGRPEHDRGDEVRGMYLNTVPYAADTSAATWRDLVARVFAGEAELWPNRRYPMPAIQREWGGEGTLIEVAFGFLDFHVMDWNSESVGMVDDFSPSELPLEVWTFPGILRLGGRPSRIGAEQLELLARLYRHVLEAMAADPDGDATAIGLPPADAAAAIAAGNDTDRPFPGGPFVHDLVRARAESTPDAIALRQGETTVTYAELLANADALAEHLAATGVGPEKVVGLHLPRGIDLTTAMLAVLVSGAAYLPLDPEYPADRLDYMVGDAAVHTFITLSTLLRPVLPEGVRILEIDDHPHPRTTPVPATPTRHDLAAGGRTPSPPITPESLAYVIYTSGSTGKPKGVAVPHRGALNLRHAQLEHLDVRPGDRVLQFASPSFDASVWELLMALTNGAELVLPPPDTDPGDLRAQAALVTHMTVPPSILDRYSPADFPALRVVVSAGEACTGEQVARWADAATFVNAYGPTEITVCASLSAIPATGAPAAPSIGLPIGNVKGYVLDAELRPLATGVRGELYVGGPGVVRGYLGKPGLTADRFLPDPYSAEPGARLYRTGDVVSRNADGTLQYHGRADHQVKIRGLRVELGEIEEALAGHPGVAGVIVTVHRGASGDATLVAYTRPSDTPATGADLREHLRDKLPRHMVPTHYISVEEFPTTPAGKIDRAALPVPGDERPTLDLPYTAPRTDLERLMADTWAQALGVARVGVHDDFFDLGGHSLVMMRVIAALRTKAGVELRFRTFMEHRTIAGIAATVEGGGVGADALLWIRQGGTGTPLVCVHPGGGSAHWYSRLAPHIPEHVPVLAFEWPGPHPGAVPTAEVMADRYLAELRAAQPHGPYRLFSWCGGSGIATEMAHRLVNEGEQVTFMLLDPGLDVHTRPAGWSEFALIKRLDDLVTAIADGGPEQNTPARREEILTLLNHLVDDAPDGGVTLPEDGVGDMWPRAVRTWREVMEMDLTYRHRRFTGDLHLIMTDELADGEHEVADGQTADDYLGRWRELVGDVHVHRVPGDHFGVMREPHVGVLGGVVTSIIEPSGAAPEGD